MATIKTPSNDNRLLARLVADVLDEVIQAIRRAHPLGDDVMAEIKTATDKLR